MESFKTALQTHHYMCNNFASTKRALNFVHFSGNEPRMAKSAQNWRICPYGNGNLTIPDKVTQFTLQLLNVSIPVLQKCPADTYHKNQSFKRYSRFSSKNVIFRCFRTRFSRISPHGQKSRKSDLLQNLIIYRYGAACKFLGKSYGKFLKYPIFGGYFVYVFSGAAPGPSPSLKVDLLREKANAHLALEAKVKIGPLSRCVLTVNTVYLVRISLAFDRPTDKQHSTCRRTASTSPRFVPAECDDTWSVTYQSSSKWFAWATGERPPGYRNVVKISILTFLFWKSSPFPLPWGRMGTASLWGASFLLF